MTDTPAPPLYLTEPVLGGETFGRLRYHGGYWIIEDAFPAVREFAKRVFPGSRAYARGGILTFRATTRAMGDLNWLLLRYPMEISAEDLEIFHQQRERAIAHAARRKANQHLEPTTPPPSFAGELRPYQAEGVSYLLANRRTLLADDMGLGKTVVALAGLASAGAFPALIVTPANIRLQWQRMAGRFLDIDSRTLFRDETGRAITHLIQGLTPYELPKVPLYLIHYGLLAAWRDALLDLEPRAVIFDEVQELRHTGTYKYSAASVLGEKCELVWGLSGTPIYNYGGEIWAITNILDYHCLGDWDSFTREWCTGYGEKIVAAPEALADHVLREGLMLRRRKAEVASQLPPKRRIVQAIEHDDSTYVKLIKEAVSLARRYHEITEWTEKGKAARWIENESRRATGIAKAPHVAGFVRALVEAGERPLVYAWHHDVHDHLTSRFKDLRAVRITGRESSREKDESVTAFASGKADICLLSLRATAGLDGLQGQATCVVFTELDWSPAVHSQCEDRLHREGIGDLDSVLCYYLVSDTGYDSVVMDALGLKIGQFVALMGDQAETDEDRALAQQAAKDHLQKVIERLKEVA